MCLQEEKLHPLEYADRERCQKESKWKKKKQAGLRDIQVNNNQ